MKKEITKKDKDGNDNITEISYKIKFIDSFKFMSTSLSNLVNNLSERVHNDKCTDCKSCLDYMTTKDEQLIFRCFECKKKYVKNFNKKLIKRFVNIYEFCNGDINKFILLLKKGVYPYEYMDSCERFDETLLLFDYRHAKRVFKNLSNKNLGDYHDLDVQGDTLLLADVFENFRNTCIKVYEPDPAYFYQHQD